MILKFKNPPKGFQQHFLLPAVHFSSLLDSLVSNKPEKNTIYKLATFAAILVYVCTYSSRLGRSTIFPSCPAGYNIFI